MTLSFFGIDLLASLGGCESSLEVMENEHTDVLSFCYLIMMALLALIQEPEPDHALRADLAEEFNKDRKKFNKTAEEFTKKHAEKRPE
ncbi:hypothetical protein ANCCEY_11018 [Ancylostoma ceylanicum]|uniref:UBC core domain-containing protein n=1 Tax=Ancylostoma ceylanicum TaxID=53326 RepID=A0A0D6LQG2_9BILA|nr:hypothetical protein ANCCEY_11018 [Ancylostoma ceylanicum]